MPEDTRGNTTVITRGDITYALNRRPRKMRARRVAKDQFGRVYVYWEDLNAEAPVGLIDRMFTANVDIPDKYLKFDPDRPWRIAYDFAGWIRDTVEEERQWDERLKETMQRLYKEKGAEDMAPGGAGPTPAALTIVGRKPVPSVLIRALARGDAWCLGFSERRTPLVEAILGKAPKVEKKSASRRAIDESLRLPAGLEELVGQGAILSRFEDEEDEVDTRMQSVNRTADLDEEEDELAEGSGELTGGDGAEDEDELDLGDLDDDVDDVEDEPEPRKPRGGGKNSKLKRGEG